MNYVYQDKSTMNPGVTVLMIYNKDGLNNKINKNIISRIGHLSVPPVFYESCSYKNNYSNLPVIDKVNPELLYKDKEKDNVDIIDNDIFDNLINRSSKHLPTERKTRKNTRPILKIKTSNGSSNKSGRKNKSKKQLKQLKQSKKRNNKKQTKKAKVVRSK